MRTSNTLAQNIKTTMKRINVTLFALMLLGILFSCTKASINYTQNGNWVGRAFFPGPPQGFGVAFTSNNLAYVGLGINPLTPNQRLQTFYKYTIQEINAANPSEMMAPKSNGATLTNAGRSAIDCPRRNVVARSVTAPPMAATSRMPLMTSAALQIAA